MPESQKFELATWADADVVHADPPPTPEPPADEADEETTEEKS